MPITQRIYRGRRGTAILAVALYVPRRKQQKTSAPVDLQHEKRMEQAEKAGKADAEQVNVGSKFDKHLSFQKSHTNP